jgi:hypothetical protein
MGFGRLVRVGVLITAGLAAWALLLWVVAWLF